MRNAQMLPPKKKPFKKARPDAKTNSSNSSSSTNAIISSSVSVKDHTCSVCQKIFIKASDVPRHMKIHTEEIFSCEFCNKSYTQKGQLTRHVRDAHWKLKVPGNKIKPQWRERSKEKVKCKFCDKWLHRCSVVRHVRNVHLKEIANTEKEDTDITETVAANVAHTTKEEIDTSVEDRCASVNESDSDLDLAGNKNRIKTKKSTSPPMKGGKTKAVKSVAGGSSVKTISASSNLTIEEGRDEEGISVSDCGATVEGRLWKCPVCSIIFIHIGELKIHLTIHAGKLPYKCRVCSAEFNGREKFVEHSKIHQNRKESKVFHVCSICDKSFTRKSSYLTHTLLVHKREKKFQCDLCGKAYGDRKTLRLHHRRFHSA